MPFSISDIVSVVPLGKPTGQLIYMDYRYPSKRDIRLKALNKILDKNKTLENGIHNK